MDRRQFLTNSFIMTSSIFLFHHKNVYALKMGKMSLWQNEKNIKDDFFWRNLCNVNNISELYHNVNEGTEKYYLSTTDEEKKGQIPINNKLISAFSTKIDRTVLIPKGNYLISDTILCKVVGNLNIRCEPGVIFSLASNVRKNIFVIVGDKTNKLSWCGGEINGNWMLQGGEKLNNNKIIDVSHGLAVSMFDFARIESLYIHDCMGHHINHGGNNKFEAHDITIRSHPSKVYPLGGARGDGITGCSKVTHIQRVRGFSTDDLIAVFSGADWIPGIDGQNFTDIEDIVVKDIDAYAVTAGENNDIFYTWHACTIGNINGGSIKKINIDNINGMCQENNIRIISGTGKEYWGSFGVIKISNVQSYVKSKPHGSWTDKITSAHIVIGRSNPNDLSVDKKQVIERLEIKNLSLNGSSGSISGISIGNIFIKRANIESVEINYSNDYQYMSAVNVGGSDAIGLLVIKDIKQKYSDNIKIDSVRLILNSNYQGKDVIPCEVKNVSSKKIGNKNLSNISIYVKKEKKNFNMVFLDGNINLG